VVAVFFLLGLVSAAWASRIPAIKGSLRLSAGSLGVALLGAAVGSIIAMPITGIVLNAVAPRRVVQLAFVPAAGLVPVITAAHSTAQLFLVLLGWGIGIGAIDVATNTEAAQVQDMAGRSIMSGFHASYSIGGLVGAGTGALAAAGGLAVRWHFLAVGLFTLIAAVVAAQAFPDLRDPADDRRRPDRRQRVLPAPTLAIAALALVAFGCFLAEGAANDWSGVYLHTSLRTSPGFAPVGYAVFACAMAVGRLVGDRLADRFGPTRLVRTSATMAAVGFGAALLIGHPAAALVGFAFLGLGLSVVVPSVFTAAAGLGNTGPSLATVTSFGYLGLMAGPPMIGGLSEVIGLPEALSVVVVIAGLTALLAPFLGSGSPAGPGGPVGPVGAAGSGAAAGSGGAADPKQVEVRAG
jgi:predicted MFS family arabinose efflux permease